MKSSLNDLLIYVLEFLLEGERRSVFCRPVDASNGVVLEETSDGSGIMCGVLLGGKTFEIPLPQILKIEQYKVTYRPGEVGGQTAKTVTVGANKVQDIIANQTDSETGEVKGIAKIQEVGNPENAVEWEPEGWKL